MNMHQQCKLIWHRVSLNKSREPFNVCVFLRSWFKQH